MELHGTRPEREELERRWYAQGWYRDATVADEMRAGVVANGGARIVYASDDRPAEATMGELFAAATGVAGAYQALGIGAGDVVAIQVPNWLEGTIAYGAALLTGAVVVPIVHIYGAAELEFILRQSGARMLVVPDRWRSIDYLARLDALPALPTLEHVVVIGDAVPSAARAWTELVASDAPFSAPELRADDVCFLVYTSGTTAEPKGVLHTHNTFLAELRPGPDAAPRAPGATLSAFPAGHIAGLMGLVRLFMTGGTTVVMDLWDPALGAALVEEHGVTRTAGTPFHLSTLLDAGARDRRDLTGLSDYMVGAAAVPPALMERADAAGIAVYRAYGSSEHPTITSGTGTDPRAKRIGTDGRVLPGNEVRIVDDDGDDVTPGTDGEVAARGPEQFVGYQDPSANDGLFLPGGWFRTGDVGHLDADGFLTITDRKKDVIIRAGENVSSKEVEDVLARHPAVAEAAVVAAPDERYGERVAAFVCLVPGAALTLDDLRAHFTASGVARQKTPERLEVVDDLPRTPAGKVKKFELRDRLR